MTIQILPTKPNAAARFGASYGKYLSENIPKEAERRGLSEDLKNISEQKGLTPFQQFAGLASARGATPQIVESGSKLLQHQAKMDAYNRRVNKTGEVPMPERSGFDERMDVYGQQAGQRPSATTAMERKGVEAEPTQTGASTESPLAEKFLPAQPFTQSMREDAIDNAYTSGLATTFDEASAIADDAERRYMQAPEQYRKDLEYRMKIDKEVDDLYDKELETRLQKKGNETFVDLNGDEQLNIKKKARNDVATGKMTPQQAAETYSKKSLDIAKDKSRVREIANRDVLDRIMPGKKEEALKNLKNISKNFSDLDMQEDYYNLLRKDTNEKGDQIGMGLSKGGAAMIAFPRSENVVKLMNESRLLKTPTETRRFASDLISKMGPKDSFLAIARNMKQKYPGFDENAYFDYLRENQGNLALSPTQKREINAGVSDFFPDWRDIGLFPAFTKSVAND